MRALWPGYLFISFSTAHGASAFQGGPPHPGTAPLGLRADIPSQGWSSPQDTGLRAQARGLWAPKPPGVTVT